MSSFAQWYIPALSGFQEFARRFTACGDALISTYMRMMEVSRVTIRRIKTLVTGTKGANVVVRAFKDWEAGGFLCLSVKCRFEEPRCQNCIFISALSPVDSWHAFHPEQGKIKVEVCWLCDTSSDSHGHRRLSLLPTTTNTRVHVRSTGSAPSLFHSFTLWWLSRPPIHCHNTFIYTGCAIAPRQKSKHRSHSTAH